MLIIKEMATVMMKITMKNVDTIEEIVVIMTMILPLIIVMNVNV